MKDKVYFTSDTHYFHKNIMEFSNRPFKDVDHMNDVLVDTWNSVVDPDDTVYHCGDVSLGPSNKTNNLLQRLNGKIHLIIGNHEKSILSNNGCKDRFESINQYLTVKVPDEDARGGNQEIFMCHYAMRVWDKSHHGKWHLYGHSHDSLEHEVWGRSMDCGVDSAARILGSYIPFSYREIKQIMSKREFKGVDHHEER